MKTTILIGFARTDASGNPIGAPSIVSGPPAGEEDRREQSRIFLDAKQLHRFPKGVAWLGFGNVEIETCASFISKDVEAHIAASKEIEQNRIGEALKKAEAQQKHKQQLEDALARVRKAAVAFNNASALLKTHKDRVLDAEANYKSTKLDTYKTAIENEKAKVDSATKAEAEARNEFNAAKQHHADLKAGKQVAETKKSTK